MRKGWGRAARAAFPVTLPVLTGYVFLGMAFGILLESKGYGLIWALLLSVFVYAGSMQFVAVSLLAGTFSPLQVFCLTLMVNARHIFYGISMLAPFARLPRRMKPYMIFSLTDETFSLLVSGEVPRDVDENAYRLCISAMNQCYWVLGSTLGSLLGSAVSLNTKGIEFVMTALFVVIFLEQWGTKRGRVPAVLGGSAALLCLMLFGFTWFLLPTMGILLLTLWLLRGRLEGGKAE